jgi:hypothetical protein
MTTPEPCPEPDSPLTEMLTTLDSASSATEAQSTLAPDTAPAGDAGDAEVDEEVGPDEVSASAALSLGDAVQAVPPMRITTTEAARRRP